MKRREEQHVPREKNPRDKMSQTQKRQEGQKITSDKTSQRPMFWYDI